MSSTRNVATQTPPRHCVERSSTLSLPSENLGNAVRPPTFVKLMVTCTHYVEYSVRLPPSADELTEADMRKIDVVLPDGKLIVNISLRSELRLHVE
jgi:hypothetical protein